MLQTAITRSLPRLWLILAVLLLFVRCCAGSAYCIPCPMGTYSDTTGTAECTEW